MIKAVLFDFDGVLTIDKTGSTSTINYIAANTGIDYDTFKTCYYRYNKGLLSGEFTHRDIWDQLCGEAGMDIDYGVLIEAFKSTKLDMDMLALVRELKASYRIGMVTDNKQDRIDTISSCHGFDRLFDTISISAKFHSGKEEEKIFAATMDALSVSPEECVFIDNTPKNLVVPEKLGMKTMLFDDEDRDIVRFRKDLERMIKE